MAIALQCVPPSVAPIMVGIAQHESGLDPHAIHRNSNGTLDVGIAQINTANFGWLGLTMETAFDPCRNLAAGSKVLFAKYNGSPPDAVRSAYASDVMARISALDGQEAPPVAPGPSCHDASPDPTGWHAQAPCQPTDDDAWHTIPSTKKPDEKNISTDHK
jgi:type IV secretion system protein VirB1